jgi:hypothetical protein
MLTIKGMADHVAASGFPPLADLLNTYIDAGGKMYVCGPYVGSRKIAPEDMVQGTSIVRRRRDLCRRMCCGDKRACLLSHRIKGIDPIYFPFTQHGLKREWR